MCCHKVQLGEDMRSRKVLMGTPKRKSLVGLILAFMRRIAPVTKKHQKQKPQQPTKNTKNKLRATEKNSFVSTEILKACGVCAQAGR